MMRAGRIDIPRSAALDFIQEMITKLLVPLVAFLSLLLLPGTAFHVPEAAAQEGTTTTISGRVQVQGATGHDGVTVQLGLATALTAADGSFSFTGVQPGIYTLSAQATGYLAVRAAGLVVDGGDALDLGELPLLAGDVNGDPRTGDPGAGAHTATRAVLRWPLRRGDRRDHRQRRCWPGRHCRRSVHGDAPPGSAGYLG